MEGKMKKRFFLFVPLIVVLVCAAVWFVSGGSGTKEHLESRLGLSLPIGTEIVCEDSHGGFHGDGVLAAVVRFPDSQAGESAIQSIAKQWTPLPVEESWMEQFQSMWVEHKETLGVLPQHADGFWFYRDRYKEQYGETCSFNPVLQNCTFAMLDSGSGRLYVLEVDC